MIRVTPADLAASITRGGLRGAVVEVVRGNQDQRFDPFSTVGLAVA